MGGRILCWMTFFPVIAMAIASGCRRREEMVEDCRRGGGGGAADPGRASLHQLRPQPSASSSSSTTPGSGPSHRVLPRGSTA